MLHAKKSLAFLFTLLLAIVFTLPAQADAAAKKILLRLGHEMPETHPYHAGAQKFADILSQKTNGEVAVQVFPNGTLGKQAQMVDGLTMGTLDLSLTNTVVLEKYEPLMSVLVMPYVIRGWDHVYKVVDGEIGQELNKGLEKKGITVLAYHEIGLTNINSIKPINHPSDVKGIKLRVQPGPSYVEVGKILGAVVATTAFSEVYTALQLGTIDAQVQSASNIRQSKFYEVAKYYTVNELGFFLEPLSMSKMVWDRMTPAHQKALKEAAYESALWQRPYARGKQDEDLAYLEKNHGVIVIKPDVTEWRKVIEPIHDKFPQWSDLIKRIKAIQ
ncbi:DctP family TRAP transporter solute receptor [uncultured delta proteobacterium]|uniref:DctP family TRAP transporter solute receptor n=1 Tax=uncultured delta proteobacterium TaxID=34034 RepID=A0A212JJR0_9DELT|nr:DctP family TRAP transporter solute receptor [uncultured delta proteobacterium]